MQVQVVGEVQKNAIVCSSLQQLLIPQGFAVKAGSLEDIPPLYSPFHKSKADLYIYHEVQYCKRGTVTGTACLSDSREDDCTIISGVCEMKNKVKAIKQLYANMLHFTAQLVVRALKEGNIVTNAVTYGLSVQYEAQLASLVRMTIDFDAACTTLEEFGEFPLAEALNAVVGNLFDHTLK